MANAQSRKRSSELAQRVRGGQRRADSVTLAETVSLAAAGDYGNDDHGVSDSTMFEPDVDTGLSEPSSGVWSFGPPIKK